MTQKKQSRDCSLCKGTGKLHDLYDGEICDNCDGTGKVTR